MPATCFYQQVNLFLIVRFIYPVLKIQHLFAIPHAVISFYIAIKSQTNHLTCTVSMRFQRR